MEPELKFSALRAGGTTTCAAEGLGTFVSLGKLCNRKVLNLKNYVEEFGKEKYENVRSETLVIPRKRSSSTVG